jgi:dTDP-4-dehydrorhamnose reductase
MRILITGGSGLLGGNVLRVAHERFGAEVVALLHRRTLPEDRIIAQEPTDLRDRAELERQLDRLRPDAVIHCAFVNDLRRIHDAPDEAWEVMVTGTRHLMGAARAVGAHPILVSTDWVFDGRDAPAREAAPPAPVNAYGLLKTVGEQIALAEGGAAARVAGLFGVHWTRSDWRGEQNAGFGNLPDAAVRELAAGRPFELWMGSQVNRSANPTLASDAADLILRIAERRAHGTFHCVGADGYDRLALARASATAFDLDPDLVRPRDADDPTLAGIAIPGDTRLDGSVTERALERPRLPLDRALATFRRQLESGAL